MIITASAPAKIILTGEHAVVYGTPAIALPVANNLATTTILSRNNNKKINLVLSDLNYEKSFELQELILLSQKIQKQYELFLTKKLGINDVLANQAEIFPFALVKFSEFFASRLQLSLENVLQEFKNHEIIITANIPLYCGMGSSAATIVSLLHAFLEFLLQKKLLFLNADEYLEKNYDECFALARSVENIQHGNSSGLDIAMALKNKPIYFLNGKIFPRKFLPFPLRLQNTGRPESTTGECVTSVEKYFKDTKLLNDFAAVTIEIDKILQTQFLSLANLQDCIKENHRLLCKIGVVPESVKALIRDLEQKGFAAKISGAGAILGEKAGMIIVIGDE